MFALLSVAAADYVNAEDNVVIVTGRKLEGQETCETRGYVSIRDLDACVKAARVHRTIGNWDMPVRAQGCNRNMPNHCYAYKYGRSGNVRFVKDSCPVHSGQSIYKTYLICHARVPSQPVVQGCDLFTDMHACNGSKGKADQCVWNGDRRLCQPITVVWDRVKAHQGCGTFGYESITSFETCKAAAIRLGSLDSRYRYPTGELSSCNDRVPNHCWHNQSKDVKFTPTTCHTHRKDAHTLDKVICWATNQACTKVTFTTRNEHNAESGGTFHVDGYGDISPPKKHRSLTINVCVSRLKVTANTSDEWFFDVKLGGSSKKFTLKGATYEPCNTGICDWRSYLDRYIDLQNAFGDDLGAAKNHYRDYGRREGRDCTRLGGTVGNCQGHEWGKLGTSRYDRSQTWPSFGSFD